MATQRHPRHGSTNARLAVLAVTHRATMADRSRVAACRGFRPAPEWRREEAIGSDPRDVMAAKAATHDTAPRMRGWPSSRWCIARAWRTVRPLRRVVNSGLRRDDVGGWDGAPSDFKGVRRRSTVLAHTNLLVVRNACTRQTLHATMLGLARGLDPTYALPSC